MSDIITTPNTTSPELFRYFNRRHCRLVSVRADGAIYTRIIGEDWEPNRPAAANAAELDARIAKTRLYLDQAPVWTTKITDLPDPDMIERWIMDGVVEATDGTDVNPPGPFQRRIAPPEPHMGSYESTLLFQDSMSIAPNFGSVAIFYLTASCCMIPANGFCGTTDGDRLQRKPF